MGPPRCSFSGITHEIAWIIGSKTGLFRGSNPGPLRPKRRIIPLDQTAASGCENTFSKPSCQIRNPKTLTKKRHRQGSNLRGQSPSEFKSDSLTTRTQCHPAFDTCNQFYSHESKTIKKKYAPYWDWTSDLAVNSRTLWPTELTEHSYWS